MSTEHDTRTARLMARFRWLLVVLAASLCAFSWWSFARADPTSDSAPRFYCPMHPEVTSHDPAECPICHMTLEPIPEARKHAPPKPPATKTPSGAPALPVGLTPELELRLDRLQAINVRTRQARLLPGSGSLSVPAVVEAQEGGRAQVHVRSSGFVEAISVREMGAKVKAGQLLFSLYSPEIYQAQAELLALVKTQGSAETVERAKRRLELLGVPVAASDKLINGGAAQRSVPISSPMSGYLARVNIVRGSFVTPELALYEVVDPSRVYVVASVPQARAREVALGQSASFVSEGGQRREVGKIDLIYPELDRALRSVRVRLSLENRDGSILPGQFGNVELALPAESSVAVPRDAVVDTGRSAYVFVDLGKGKLRAIPVVVGRALPNDELEIQQGVSAADRVVSGATFLIDSESRLRAAISPVE
jgi:Cu(I)/Ag(I) efflux system membrane fusion protein